MLASPLAGLRPFVDSAAAIASTFPFGVAKTLAGDPLAIALAGAGLTVGWRLSTWSGRRIGAIDTSFWHRHREALRTALRRSPSMAAPSQDHVAHEFRQEWRSNDWPNESIARHVY
jgi:hypothetical protein